jgi:tRNA threonylcarbamoyl adenosine modification protein YjeE
MAGESRPFAAVQELHSMEDTEALGQRIAARLGRGDAVALAGDLGAGKTTLARAILHAMGVMENVPSPTFTLVQTYETQRFPVRHFDLYRVETVSELDELGLDEALDEGAALIEWPERAETSLPVTTLRVALSVEGDGARRVALSGPASWKSAFGAAHVR